MASSMYGRVELNKPTTDLCQDADKNVGMALRRYKKDYDRRVHFVPIFPVDDYIYLDRPALFYSAAE